MVRYLFIKFTNEIDTSKQLLLFEAVHRNFFTNQAELNESSMTLGLQILHDSIVLKFGNRVSHLSVIQILDSLTYLMNNSSKLARIEKDSTYSAQLATTLRTLFYFKYSSVSQIYQTSQIDIATSKTIFTHHIYQKHHAQIFKYFGLFIEEPSLIPAKPLDLGDGVDFGSVIGLRTRD